MKYSNERILYLKNFTRSIISLYDLNCNKTAIINFFYCKGVTLINCVVEKSRYDDIYIPNYYLNKFYQEFRYLNVKKLDLFEFNAEKSKIPI